MLAKIAVGALLTVALLTAYVLRDGFLVVRVDETSPEVHHVHLWLPATFASAALAFTPKDKLRKAAEKAGPWLEVARASCRQLERAPDFTLADVTDPTDHVTVQKRGGNIEVSVDDPNDKVFVSVPLVSIEEVTDQLQSMRPAL
jgi:hypothetical protein